MVQIQQVRPDQVPTVREMMTEYLSWAFKLQEGSSDAPTFQGVDEELKELPGIFSPPKGRFFVAELEGSVCGCIVLKPIDDITCELKRLYVRPAARGKNLGTSLIERLIRDAREIGYKKIVLDSHKSMTSAHVLYRMAGFKDVPAPADFPENLKPHVVFMEKTL